LPTEATSDLAQTTPGRAGMMMGLRAVPAPVLCEACARCQHRAAAAV